jgi:hypothetical protein
MALRLTLSRVDAEPSPLRGQCQRPGEGRGCLNADFSSLRGGRRRPGTLSRKGLGLSGFARRRGVVCRERGGSVLGGGEVLVELEDGVSSMST